MAISENRRPSVAYRENTVRYLPLSELSHCGIAWRLGIVGKKNGFHTIVSRIAIMNPSLPVCPAPAPAAAIDAQRLDSITPRIVLVRIGHEPRRLIFVSYKSDLDATA